MKTLGEAEECHDAVKKMMVLCLKRWLVVMWRKEMSKMIMILTMKQIVEDIGLSYHVV